MRPETLDILTKCMYLMLNMETQNKHEKLNLEMHCLKKQCNAPHFILANLINNRI